MQLNYMAFILPLFFIFCVVEYYFGLKKDKRLFNFSESVSNVNVGIFERTCDLFTTGLFHSWFVWLYNEYAVFDIESNIATWIFLFLLTDFLWYWYHRFGHKVNILWSAHAVHHQSEDFNFTVSARITVIQAVFRSLFWSFIPLLGFPPEMITVMLLIHGAYPFFTHTQLVGKLGVLEKVLVTPSHHRVHHSSNEMYLDKNFGDMLIIWDKMFGTFVEEDERVKPVYGLTSPLKSYSFLWQHFHFMLEIIVAVKRAKGLKEKLKAVFGKPDDLNPEVRTELETRLLSTAPERKLSDVLINFVGVNTIITFIFVFFFLLFGFYQTSSQLLVGGLFVFVSVIHTGAMLEQRCWLFHIEFMRFVLLGIYTGLFFPYSEVVSAIVIAIMILTFFYNTASKNYLRILTIDISRNDNSN